MGHHNNLGCCCRLWLLRARWQDMRRRGTRHGPVAVSSFVAAASVDGAMEGNVR